MRTCFPAAAVHSRHSLPDLRGGEGARRQIRIAETISISTMPSRRMREHTASVRPKKANWRCAISRPFAATAISR
jgi:hypothetical protein